MAKHLDLEEQEQLDELKHFWKKYGDLITWVLIAVFGAVAAWNGYQYWQVRQTAQASALYEEVDRAAQANDLPRMDLAYAELKDRFGSTLYAGQAGLLVAKTQFDKGNADASRAALTWLSANALDEGYKALAKLRLSGLLMDAKAYDDALRLVSDKFPADFVALASDRKGDILSAQGKKSEARAEYEKAYKSIDARADYRRLVEVKLNAMGADPGAVVSSDAEKAVSEPKK